MPETCIPRHSYTRTNFQFTLQTSHPSSQSSAISHQYHTLAAIRYHIKPPHPFYILTMRFPASNLTTNRSCLDPRDGGAPNPGRAATAMATTMYSDDAQPRDGG
ncbi:hypothetical protein NX059_007440 [Plenodomus lindquistii]|nr:hypothetical protein NX059_007440 [Plenodomus lindquistii]